MSNGAKVTEMKWTTKPKEVVPQPKVTVEQVDVNELINQFPYKLYGQRVMAYEIEVETVSGLYVPETSKRDGEMRTNTGYVIGVGDEVTFCKPGDTVLFGRYSGAWQELEGKRYRLMNEEDLLAKVVAKKELYNAI